MFIKAVNNILINQQEKNQQLEQQTQQTQQPTTKKKKQVNKNPKPIEKPLDKKSTSNKNSKSIAKSVENNSKQIIEPLENIEVGEEHKVLHGFMAAISGLGIIGIILLILCFIGGILWILINDKNWYKDKPPNNPNKPPTDPNKPPTNNNNPKFDFDVDSAAIKKRNPNISQELNELKKLYEEYLKKECDKEEMTHLMGLKINNKEFTPFNTNNLNLKQYKKLDRDLKNIFDNNNKSAILNMMLDVTSSWVNSMNQYEDLYKKLYN